MPNSDVRQQATTTTIGRYRRVERADDNIMKMTSKFFTGRRVPVRKSLGGHFLKRGKSRMIRIGKLFFSIECEPVSTEYIIFDPHRIKTEED